MVVVVVINEAIYYEYITLRTNVKLEMKYELLAMLWCLHFDPVL